MPVLKLLPKAVLLVDDVVKPVAPKIVKTVARPRPPLITSTSPAPAPPAGPRPYDVVLGGRRPPSPVTEAGPRPYDVVLGSRRPTGFRPFPTQPTPSPPRPPSLAQQAGRQFLENLDLTTPNPVGDAINNALAAALAAAILAQLENLVNLGQRQVPRPPTDPDPTPNPNTFNFPYNPAWRNMRGYAVATFAYSAVNIGTADWELVGGITRTGPADAYSYDTYAFIEGRIHSIDASQLYYGSPLDDGSMEHGDFVFIWQFTYTDYLDQIIANGGSLNISFDEQDPFTLVDTRWYNLPEPLPQEESSPDGFPEIIILDPPRPEEEDVTCDLSAIQSILRRQQQILNGLQANVSNANLAINANIDTLKPPINQINATTQTISAKADDLASGLTNVRDIASATNTNVTNVASTVNSTASKVDDLASGLNNVRDIARNTADKVDSVADAVNGMGNNINNIGNRVNDIWNKLGEVGNKIGENFTKTMERFDKLSKWLKLPMIFDALSLILLLHNAAMLSSNLVQTLGQIIDVGLDVIGLKDENGESFDVAQILGQQANNFMKSILGEANWTQTTTTWKKLSNIYQAAANVIYSVQSIIDSARSIMELGAQMTGKIGNALRAAGVVFENAFNWFPEEINSATARQNKLNGMIQGIQNIDDTASSLSSAVSEVKSIQDTVIEMREQRQKFNEAVDELVTGKSNEESNKKDKSQSPPVEP